MYHFSNFSYSFTKKNHEAAARRKSSKIYCFIWLIKTRVKEFPCTQLIFCHGKKPVQPDGFEVLYVTPCVSVNSTKTLSPHLTKLLEKKIIFEIYITGKSSRHLGSIPLKCFKSSLELDDCKRRKRKISTYCTGFMTQYFCRYLILIRYQR